MIMKVTMYEASDGTLLPSKEAAIVYEDQLDLLDYVTENPIEAYGGQHGSDHITGPALQLWLRKNPRVFMKLLPKQELAK